VNCCDESSTAKSNGRPHGRRTAEATTRRPTRTIPPLLLAVMTFLSGPATHAAGLHDLFADYLLTGQQPHPAVARVVAPDGTGTSLGSGVLVDINASQALVLTNWHVVRDARSAVLVQFPDGFQSAGTIVRVDQTWDLAAIVIWKPAVEPVRLATRPPAIGETLTIAGYGRGPFRAESGACTQYLSPGGGQPHELVELVATARQGDSGGPIFNAAGELAGVLFGQADGRTVGASGPRIRIFLATLGSDGYDPAALPPQPDALARSSQPTFQQASQQARPAERLPVASTAAQASPPAAIAPGGIAEAAEGPAIGWLMPILDDPLAHAQTILSAVGAASLVLFGLRGILRTLAPAR